MRTFITGIIVPSFMAGMLALAGCDKGDAGNTAKPAEQKQAAEKPKPATQPIIPIAQANDWCPEHGVPESVCTRCNESLTAGFKEKGDWCEEHKLPDSQCFVHHPELKEKFASAYKAKYGKDAPPMAEEKDEKK